MSQSLLESLVGKTAFRHAAGSHDLSEEALILYCAPMRKKGGRASYKVIERKSSKSKIEKIGSRISTFGIPSSFSMQLGLAGANVAFLTDASSRLSGGIRSEFGKFTKTLRQFSAFEFVRWEAERLAISSLVTELFVHSAEDISNDQTRSEISAALRVSRSMLGSLAELLAGLRLNEPLPQELLATAKALGNDLHTMLDLNEDI